ncbi:Anthranilate phosphoribosyltransferase [Candidatus Tremblaya princeps]|uniref:Anthranilate phosphoribosyltransferase n=2 Tax=Tremblaya princeps TaxID=189385 RepID=A0A1C3K906_TREPR|nr:Anthranilate phosphoribosyltransferase [Candidatus Tremblaya princeps]
MSSSVSTSHACIDGPCTPSVTAKLAVLVHGSPQYSLRAMEQPLHAFAPSDGLLRTARMLRNIGPCRDGATIRAPSIDSVGTGGGRARRLNESTLASVAIASMGALAAKHGGSGITRRHGSANAMGLLGYATTGYTYALRLIEAGCGFLLSSARLPHASRTARLRRKALRPGLVSAAAPLTCSSSVTATLLGTYSLGLMRSMAAVSARSGCASTLCVHGAGAVDEVSVHGGTLIAHMYSGAVITRTDMPGALAWAEASRGEPVPSDHVDAQLAILCGGEHPAMLHVCSAVRGIAEACLGNSSSRKMHAARAAITTISEGWAYRGAAEFARAP